MASSDLSLTGNALLDLLPLPDRKSILSRLRPAPIEIREEYQTNLRPASHVYFPLSGMLSLMATVNGELAIETATVGNEGMVGASIVLGPLTAEGRVIGQIEGRMLTMSADHFRGLVEGDGKFREVIHTYLLALMAQISQSVACNGLHSLNERLARWLLQSQDRAMADQFMLTQEFLSHMLGVRRPSVSVAAGTLQEAGLIRFRRGMVQVLNREGLEEASCPCYRLVVDAYERLVTRRANGRVGGK